MCWETGCPGLLNPLYLLCSIHEESLHPSWSSAAGHSTADCHFGLQKLTTRSEAWERTGYRCKSILTYLCNSQFWSSICTCTCLRSLIEEWKLWYEPFAVAWKASSISPQFSDKFHRATTCGMRHLHYKDFFCRPELRASSPMALHMSKAFHSLVIPLFALLRTGTSPAMRCATKASDILWPFFNWTTACGMRWLHYHDFFSLVRINSIQHHGIAQFFVST